MGWGRFIFTIDYFRIVLLIVNASTVAPEAS